MDSQPNNKFRSKLFNKVMTAQARELVSNVVKFMRAEAEVDGFLIDVKKVNKRVSAATGVSERTISRIKAERTKVEKSGSSFETPNKHNRVRPKRVIRLEKFDLGAIRRIVHNFYLFEKRLPTLDLILGKMQAELNFKGSKSTVSLILRRMGFKWRKTNTRKRLLMEEQEVCIKRFFYLKKIARYRKEGRPIVYTGESYIDLTHVSKGCQDELASGVCVPSKGDRLIFLYAGGEMGLIKDCLLMWKAKHKTGNHQDMDPSNYKKWLSEKLIPNLPPRSVLVIDNASYQNVEVEKCPTSNSKKADMHTWLMKKGVPFSNNMLKVELLQLIDIHKSGHKRYVIDEMLGEHGHTALKLPPYHPELNSIELIRAKVNWVEEQNVSFKLDEVENLTRQKLESITTEFWKKICDDTKTIEREFTQNQGPMEDAIDSLVINLEIKSSGEEESPASENTDDSDGNISGDEDEELKYEDNF